MKNRTPSLVICSLVLITLLLVFYYISCQSKAVELQHTSNQFEDRIRLLTIKNVGYEKTIEAILVNKRILENDKSNMKTQMDNQTLEINNLNRKLKENFVELQKLISDKKLLEEQLKKLKVISEKIISKNSALRKTQKDVGEQKKSNEQQLNVFMKQLNNLKQQVETYKQQLDQSQEKLTTLLHLTSSTTTRTTMRTTTTTTTTTRTTKTSTLLVTHHSSTEPLMSSDVVDQELDDSNDQQSLLKSLNDLLYNNETDSGVGNTPMIAIRTTVLPLNERNLVNNEHIHIEDYLEETEVNKKA